MKPHSIPLVVMMCTLAGTNTLQAAGNLAATYLRTEYKVNPTGIDETKPRLSWIVESEERGQRQTAYRVLVASSRKALEADKGDLWDSGKVSSDETTAIVYAGKPLQTGMRCQWKVKVWDRVGEPSDWSERAHWSMGLLQDSNWKAQWIGYDRPLSELAGAAASGLEKALWIWYPEGNPATSAPVGIRYFRRELDLPANRTIQKAVMLIAADNQSTVTFNGKEIGNANSFSVASQFDVTEHVRGGKNVVAVAVNNVGDSPNPAGLMGALRVEFTEGEPLVVTTDARWQSRDKEQAGWVAAKEIGRNGDKPWGKVSVHKLRLPPPRYLRKAFVMKKIPRRATLYVAAQGMYEFHINGHRVGKDYFTPGWTDYNQRIYYNTYDVKGMFRGCDAAVGAVLADGWYAGYVGFGGGRDHYGDKIRLLAQLELEFSDGTRQTIATGPDWKASTGPLWEADFLMGESYDARKAVPDWARFGFDDSGWDPVDVTPSVSAKVQAYPGPTVREMKPLVPVKMTEPKPGHFVFDLGQNFAGVVRLRVKGPAGQVITLRHVEMVNPDGTIYTANLRSARCLDRYICRGDDKEEVWQPRFTFHGFRYVEVTGYPGRPGKEAITGIPFSSATPVVGSFQCSKELVNQLFSNICWTQRMNFIDIPTDCPQRDERLGWTGDAQVYIRTASMIADTQAFFTKWLVDLTDAQREDGQFPMVAPLKSKGVSADGGPAWADAGVICPWTVYEVYGDRRLLERQYESMKRFVTFCRGRCTKDLFPPQKFHCFGDWLSIRADTPKDVILLAYFAYSTQLTARAAEALGRETDAARYQELFEKIKFAFNKAFVASDGRIKGNTQTCYVLALQFDLLDGEKRKLAEKYLVEDIKSRDWHLSTGFIGTKDLMLVLSKIGREDVAYRLLLNTTFPSWGFSIKHGATTIWERWNGWTPEKGFFDPGMNSFAHYSFGAVAQWLFETVGGINTEGPAFKKIVIRPRPGGDLRWATTSYKSIRGQIATDWKLEGEILKLNVTVPANTTATVHLPASDASQVTEGGKPTARSAGVKLLKSEEGVAIYEVGSGKYSFASKP